MGLLQQTLCGRIQTHDNNEQKKNVCCVYHEWTGYKIVNIVNTPTLTTIVAIPMCQTKPNSVLRIYVCGNPMKTSAYVGCFLRAHTRIINIYAPTDRLQTNTHTHTQAHTETLTHTHTLVGKTKCGRWALTTFDTNRWCFRDYNCWSEPCVRVATAIELR